MLHVFWSFAAFIVALSVLITVHEFGHFWVARRCGVTVERFSIGFGRVLWRWHDKFGTEYVIAAIPLGGYVKMLDERVDIVAPERYHESFNHKTVWQHAMIIVAGPVFNFLFAIFSYWLVFLVGMPTYRPVIGDIIPNSIVAQAKISPGMELKSVDGIKTPDWNSVRLQLIDKIGDAEISIGIAPFDSVHSERKILNLRGWRFELDKQDPIVALGIIPFSLRIEPTIAEIQPGSAAVKAGLQAGDRIVTVDGQSITEWQLFMTKVHENPGQMLQVGIERQDRVMDITLIPDSKPVGKGKMEGFAGIVPKVIPLPAEYKNVRKFGPLLALSQASQETWQLIRLTISILGKFIIGDVKLNNLGGPISIAHGARVSAEYGLIYYLMFLALISVNLGIINLLPLPVLDGGHLLFLMIEKLKGEPVSERVQDVSYRIGSVFLMLLAGLALFNDFSKL